MRALRVDESSDFADGKLERAVGVEVEREEVRRGFLYGKDEAGCLVRDGGWLRGRRGGLVSMWLRLQPRRIHDRDLDGFLLTTKDPEGPRIRPWTRHLASSNGVETSIGKSQTLTPDPSVRVLGCENAFSLSRAK